MGILFFGCYHGYGCRGNLLPDVFHHLTLALLVEEPPQVPLAVESSSSATQQEISRRSGDAASSCLYVIM